MSGYVLGLDLGPNSIGWAMIAAHDDGTPANSFFDTEAAGHPPMGVRIFEAGLHNFNTAKEESLNQQRRIARSMRRNHARRNARRRSVLKVLVNAALLPEDPKERESVFHQDAYELRAHALDQALEPYQLGRAIYHLAQRRGFQSNRKSGEAKEDQGILKEIGELAAEMKAAGSRTLGEHLHKLRSESPHHRIRNRHTRRDMYLSEFERIIAAQRPHHPDKLSDDVVSRLKHFIFYQHPFELTEERRSKAPSRANLHRAPSVKGCPLERGMTCCPKGEWIAQRFRILKEVNNLRVAERYSRERELKGEERDALLALLGERDRVTFDMMRKELAKQGLHPDSMFNLERGERKALNGNVVEHKLAVAFGRSKWRSLEEGVKNLLRDAVLHEPDPSALKSALMEHGADEGKAEKLTGWNPPDGYIGYSRRALEKLVPLLEDGLNEHEAIEKAYPDRPSAGVFSFLPVLDSAETPMDLKSVTNPVVRRALVETRKVVNALVREHGVPARIVVELAREMHQGPQGRKEQSRRRAIQEKRRDEAREQLVGYGGNPNSRQDVMRWLLWKEQNKQCLYTGRPIPPTELYHGAEWEVDHILPHWQSLDDSYMNKVLVHRTANAEKRDRTPIQWLGEGSDAFLQLVARAKRCLNDSQLDFPYPKYKRLLQAEVETDQFAQRQLNDTRYIATAVVKYLQLLYPVDLRRGEKAVQSCRGGLTALLRRSWGLNSVLDDILDKDGKPLKTTDRDGVEIKSREDHRHHAIDAVVVALSTRSLLKRYQDYFKRYGRDGTGDVPLPEGWDFLRDDVERMVRRIVVSHRADRKLRGAFHEETFYGQARDREGNEIPGVFVTRKPLKDLTGKMVRNIRDAAVRDLIMARLRDRGWNGKDNALPKDWEGEGLTMADGTPIRKVRVEVPIASPVDLGHRHAISGNNHHMEIVTLPGKAPDEPRKMAAVVVPMMEAAARVRPAPGSRPEPMVRRVYDDDMEFVMSLGRKETVRLWSPFDGSEVFCVVQNLAGSFTPATTIDLYLRDVRDSRPATEGNKKPFLRLKSFRNWKDLGLKKVQVDPLGRVSPAGD